MPRFFSAMIGTAVTCAAVCSTLAQTAPSPDARAVPAAPTGGNPDTIAPRIDRLFPLVSGRIVDNTGLSSIEIGFTEAVLIPAGSVRVRDVASSAGVGVASQWYDDTTNTLHIELDGQVRAGVIDVIIDYSLTDLAGNELDGEVLNPMSPTLPTGDGVRGGTAVFRYEVLQGDANRDGVVDLLDGVAIASSLGTAAGTAGYDPLADLNGDGVINVLDVAIWAGGVGGELPAVSATPPVVVSLDPPEADPLVDPLDEVRVMFSEPIDEDGFDLRSLYLTNQQGQLFLPVSAELIDGGMAAVFSFSQAFECGRFTVSLSNALTDGTGALLALPGNKPRYDALVPPPTPTVAQHAPATMDSSIGLSGSALRGVTIEVTGPGGTATAPVTNGTYSVVAPLRANTVNNLFLTSISQCGVRSAPVVTQVIMDAQPPSLHIDFPADGAEIQAESTDVAGRVSDLLSGFSGLTVLVNGVPAEVDVGIGTNGTFFLPNFPLGETGTTQITAVATDALGNTTTRSIAVQRVEIPEDAPRLELISGTGQSGPVQQFLPQPVTVRVLNGNGTPMVGKVVTFTVTRSDGVVAPEAFEQGSLVYQTLSNSQGIARAFWRLGTDAGCGNNRIEVTSRDIAGTVAFCASAMPGPAHQINIGSGNSQRGEAGAPLPLPLRVFVSDGCNGVANLPIEFSVVAGDGVFDNGQSSIIVDTANTGHAQAAFNLGLTPGTNRVRATFAGNPNAPAEFVLTGIERVEDRSTSFTGLVLDNAGQPIKDAMVRLVINGTEAGVTYSDINGLFAFPAFEGSGQTDVYVNGAVATGVGGPDNFRPVDPLTFPVLHYETVTVANAANSLGTPVLLPRMNPANVRHYSTTEPTILECEGVEGLRMIIEPGSMTMPNGAPAQHGQMMALNQVHHDDIPMPMPDGAAPPFAWTVWPPEATFDPPIRVEYPNMSGLAPGSVAYFLTFDHATGKFEIVSSGTVTPDGSTIVTDPGSGLTLSGWGCNCPPYSVAGECCVPECDENGQLTGGTIGVSVTDTVVTATISGVSDSGGTKICDDEQTSVPPGSISYTFTVTSPSGLAIATGSGASVEFNAAECGTYQIEFLASSSRECAPAPRTVSGSQMIGPDPNIVANPSVSISYTFSGLDLILFEIPPITTEFQADSTVSETCCNTESGQETRLITNGSVGISGSVDGEIDVPIPGFGTVARLIDRVVCRQIERFIPGASCDLGIRFKADGFATNGTGSFAVTTCPNLEGRYTGFMGTANLINPRLEVVVGVTIAGETATLSAVAPTNVLGVLSTDGSHLLVRMTNTGGRIALRGELPVIGEFEILGFDFPPLFDVTAFRIPLPAPEQLGGARGDEFVAIAEPLPPSEWPDEWLPSPPENVDERWELMAGAQIVQAMNRGIGLLIPNIAAPDLFGPGGPGTAPDFLSDDFVRVTGTAEIDGQTWYAFSEPFQIRQGETFVVGGLTITDIPAPLPESITLDVCDGCTPVLEIGQQVQMITTATLGNGSLQDVTPRAAWTTYRTSNPTIATVDQDGLVTTHRRGTAMITAVNEAATSTRRLDVTAQAIQTSIRGVAVFPDGSPADGAEVTLLNFGGTGITDSNGAFEIDAIVPAEMTDLSLVAILTRIDQEFIGSISGLHPAPGFTDAGVIVLQSNFCDPVWAEGLFCLPGLDGTVNTAITWNDGTGDALYVGGSFSVAGCAGGVSNIAKWDGRDWHPLTGPTDQGVSGTVFSLAVFDDGNGSALYAGGQFALAGGVPVNRVAKWDGSTWSALAGPGGTGVNSGSVLTLTVYDDGSGEALYVGGSFTEAGGLTVNRVARWNGSSWSAIATPGGIGVNGGPVYALAVFDDGGGAGLYAGGGFTLAGGLPVNRIAKWDGTAWHDLDGPLGGGVNSTVRALARFNDGGGEALYASGDFTTAGSVPVNRIAKWSGSDWSDLPGSSGVGLNGTGLAMTVFDDGQGEALFVGGLFTRAGGEVANRIARWDGLGWSTLVASGTVGVGDSVASLTTFDDGDGPALFVGGSFVTAGDAGANRIAKWDGSAWDVLAGSESAGVSGSIRTLAAFDDGSGLAIYAGGDFIYAGGVTVNRIAKWDGQSWSPLAGSNGIGVDGTVWALDVFDDGSGSALYVGGSFTTAGGLIANGVARWDGVEWAVLSGPSGTGLDGAAFAFEVHNDGTGPALFIGGQFSTAGGIAVNRIVKWDGTAWSALIGAGGTGVNSTVWSLVEFDNGKVSALYAGGDFTTAAGVTVNRIARWDGTQWSALTGPSGTGVSGTVRAVSVFDDGTGLAIYAGGTFTTAGGVTVNRIAKWDSVAWSALTGPSGTGMNDQVYGLRSFNDGTGPALYAVGEFTRAGGVQVNRIARRVDNLWESLTGPLDAGTDKAIWTIMDSSISGVPALYIGGEFGVSGGVVSERIAKWSRDCSGRSTRLLAGEERWQAASARRAASSPRPAARPAPPEAPSDWVLHSSSPQRLAADGSRRATIARLASARVLDAAEAAALLDHLPDPLANESGQRIENRPGENGTLRAYLIEPDGTEIALPTLGGTAARGEGLSSLGDVVGLSTTSDGRIEGFVWRYDAGPIESIGTLGGPGSAAMLWLGPVVVLGDADDASPEARAALWTPADGLLDLNSLIEPGSGLTLVRPRAVLGEGTVLVEAAGPGGEVVHVALDLRLYESLAGDLDGDGRVDSADIAAFVDQLNTGDPGADLNADGVVDLADIKLILEQLGREAREIGAER